jgi:hypothetical protein
MHWRLTGVHNRQPKTSAPRLTTFPWSHHSHLLYLKRLTALILDITMAQYGASVPEDGSLKAGVASFFEAFYAISDTADAHEQYADYFTSDAKLIMAAKETSGRQGI